MVDLAKVSFDMKQESGSYSYSYDRRLLYVRPLTWYAMHLFSLHEFGSRDL